MSEVYLMEDKFCLGILSISEAKMIKSKFKNLGVELDMLASENTCTTGCSPTCELWGKEKDKEMVIKVMQEEFSHNLSGHEVNHEAITAVYDAENADNKCQACGASMSGDISECPDCGLCYG